MILCLSQQKTLFPFVTSGMSSLTLKILLFLNLALLCHMAYHNKRFWDRWPMVMTFTHSRVELKKTTGRLVWFSPIRALSEGVTWRGGCGKPEESWSRDQITRQTFLIEWFHSTCFLQNSSSLYRNLQYISYSKSMHYIVMDKCAKQFLIYFF